MADDTTGRSGAKRDGTPQQQAFCQAILCGMGDVAAIRLAYPKSGLNDKAASAKAVKVRKSKWVREHLPQMQAEAAARNRIDVDRIAQWLIVVMEDGVMRQKSGKRWRTVPVAPTVRVAASNQLNKMFGHYQPRRRKGAVHFHLNFAGKDKKKDEG